MASLVQLKDSSTVAKTRSSRLDSNQTQKASKALVNQIRKVQKSSPNGTAKTDLLADADTENVTDQTPIWLILTTKKHIVDKKRLKPGRITLPYPYLRKEDQPLRICLITADPQRQFKDIVAHPNFPLDTSKHISRVIGVEKLKKKYHAYESKRQLLSEHDIFLADDRVITYLPGLLGKVFYNATAKRPIPVSLEGARQNFDEQGNKRRKLAEGGTKVVKSEPKPSDIAAEIEKTLKCALVHLAPSTNTAVKVGDASMTPEQIQANIEAVVAEFVEVYVPEKWSNVRSIHIKGPETISLPIWMAEELWVNEKEDITEDRSLAVGKSPKRKRGALSGEDTIEVPGADGKMRKLENPKKAKQSKGEESKDDDKAEKAARKEALKQQKAALNGDVPKDAVALKEEQPAKKKKKAKA